MSTRLPQSDCLVTPLLSGSTKVLLLGSGELGKELAIELMRLGAEVIACDRYAHAPAMQVAHRSHVFPMGDAQALRAVVLEEKPNLIVPEIEAIATAELVKLEKEGWHVVPTAQAARLTMDREGIRRLAAEDLELPTAKFRFADTFAEFRQAAWELGFPCVVKPLMSSSGKGQSLVRGADDLEAAWEISQSAGRTGQGRVIVEEFIHFESEITLLTVRTRAGVQFCDPIGHKQESGDYVESWQPHPMAAEQLRKAQAMAAAVTDRLGGYGIFGVELFLLGSGEVLFSEVSPRPHDTGLVTLCTQDLSEFALHARAILGLPIPAIARPYVGASCALRAPCATDTPTFYGLKEALAEPGVDVRIFGKPDAKPGRRLGVVLAKESAEKPEGLKEALAKARRAHGKIRVG